MARQDEFYYAYLKFKDQAYKKMKRSYTTSAGAYKNDISLSKNSVEVLVDNTWLDKFEECFPFIENAVEELRSFLLNEEELMPIHLANRIDVGRTLDYVTQHTDNILVYDKETNDITPEKLVNTLYENTYDIYENRFIFTLVSRLDNFLYDVIKALDDVEKTEYMKIKSVYTKNEMTTNILGNVTLAVKFDKPAESKENVIKGPNKSGRIHALREKLDEIMDSNLIRSLKNCKFVTSPLTLTNVLQKNENFKKCVELWDFLDSYNDEPLKITEQDVPVEMTKEMRDYFYEMTNFDSLVLRLALDGSFKDRVSRSGDLKKKEEERLTEEEDLRKENRIRSEVEEEQLEKYENAVKEFEDTLQRYKLRIQDYRDAMGKENAALVDEFARKADAMYVQYKKEQIELANRCDKDVAEAKAGFEAELDALKVKHEADIKQLELDHKNELEAQKNDYEAKIKDLTDGYEAKIKDLTESYEAKIKEITDSYETKIKELTDGYEAKIKGLTEFYDNKIKELENNYEEKISTLTDGYETKIKDLTDGYENTITDLKESNEKQVKDLTDGYENKISDLTASYDDKIKELTDSYETTVKNLKEDCENTVNSLKESNSREKTELTTSYETKISEMNSSRENEISLLNEVHRSEIEGLNVTFEKKLEDQKTGYEQQLTDKAVEYKDSIDKLDYEYISEINEIEAANSSKIDKLNSSHEAEKESIKADYEGRIKSLTDAHKTETDELKADYKKQIDDLRMTASEEKKFRRNFMREQQRKHNKELKQLNNELQKTKYMLDATEKKYKAEIEKLKKLYDVQK